MGMLVLSDRDANIQLRKKLSLFTGWIAMKWSGQCEAFKYDFYLTASFKTQFIDHNKCLMKSIQVGIFQLISFCSFS